MKITLWMVILDDEYYVDMALKAALPYVDGIYIQEQGCTDDSVKVIRETVKHQVPIVIDHVPHNLGRFSPAYNEPEFRNQAIDNAEMLFPKNDWLLQCDADDLYTPLFFESVKKLDAEGKLEGFNSIRQSGERFISPEWRAQEGDNELGIIQEIDGVKYLDPHTRLWRMRQGVRYVVNPEFSDGDFPFLHCVLMPEPVPVYWLPGICVIHLHRMFGPKAWAFWEEGGDVFERRTPFNPAKQAPKWFAADVNMGNAKHTPYDWPDFVIEKWLKWGEYD